MIEQQPMYRTEAEIDAVYEALHDLGVLQEDETIIAVHAWNCAEYTYPGCPCDCTPCLKFQGPDQHVAPQPRKRAA